MKLIHGQRLRRATRLSPTTECRDVTHDRHCNDRHQDVASRMTVLVASYVTVEEFVSRHGDYGD